jgi:hypothetical protein
MRLKLVVVHIDSNYVSIQLHETLKDESVWHTTCHVNDLIETIEKVLRVSDQLKYVPSVPPISYRQLKKGLINESGRSS